MRPHAEVYLHYAHDQSDSYLEFVGALLVRHAKYHLLELQMQRVLVYIREVRGEHGPARCCMCAHAGP
jgi:hypothetical protein